VGFSPGFGWRESDMGKKAKDDYKMPKKNYWHLYSLQTLNAEKFISVVNKVLKNELHLIK
jgi:hypothetical protein